MSHAKRLQIVAATLTCLVVHAAHAQQSRDPFIPFPDDASVIIATGSFGAGGALVAMQRQPPWATSVLATLDSSMPAVQSFCGRILVVEPDTDLIRVFDNDGNEVQSFSVGAGTTPRDILCVARNRAYVTRSNATHLYRVDPVTGFGEAAVDLSVFADDDGIPDMQRMASDGSRLFVQLRRTSIPARTAENGAIAVIDLHSETLIDVNPATPEIDAIELVGPAPRLRMYIDPKLEFMLVSSTDGNHLNLNGGIEYIDLQTMTSEGFLLSEIDIAALGGFVMTSRSGGYFLFHTDIVASNHLHTFTVAGGHEPGPDIVTDLGTYLDALLYDPANDLLFMPASSQGMYIVDAATNTPVTAEPIDLPGFAFDQTIGPVGNADDLTGDGVVDVFDLLALLDEWGPCPTPCAPVCVSDLVGSDGSSWDCTVDLFDLLALLESWG